MAIIVTVPFLLNQQLYKGYFFFQFPHTLIVLTIMCRILICTFTNKLKMFASKVSMVTFKITGYLIFKRIQQNDADKN